MNHWFNVFSSSGLIVVISKPTPGHLYPENLYSENESQINSFSNQR